MASYTYLLSLLLESNLEKDLQRAQWLANWLDTKFSFLGFRFGMEGVLNLMPFVGDTLTTAAGVYPVFVAYRHKLGTGLQVAMLANLGVQWVLGLVPLIGDLADVCYKANIRNVRLLERAVSKQQQSR